MSLSREKIETKGCDGKHNGKRKQKMKRQFNKIIRKTPLDEPPMPNRHCGWEY